MRLFRALARHLQFHLAPDPVENPSREDSDAVRLCGWFRFPCEEPPADFDLVYIGYGTWADPKELEALDFGSVPTPRLTTFHESEYRIERHGDHA